jgi:hypothetical protein
VQVAESMFRGIYLPVLPSSSNYQPTRQRGANFVADGFLILLTNETRFFASFFKPTFSVLTKWNM